MKESTMTPKTKSEETARGQATMVALDYSCRYGTTDEGRAFLVDLVESALRERDEKVEKLEKERDDAIRVSAAAVERADKATGTLNRAKVMSEHLREQNEKTFSDLRAKLAEAEKWMVHDVNCELVTLTTARRVGPCTCGLNNFRKTLRGMRL